jgi:hypothetical protein
MRISFRRHFFQTHFFQTHFFQTAFFQTHFFQTACACLFLDSAESPACLLAQWHLPVRLAGIMRSTVSSAGMVVLEQCVVGKLSSCDFRLLCCHSCEHCTASMLFNFLMPFVPCRWQ